MRPASAVDNRMLKLVVEAGLHFLRMIELNTTAKKYRAAFLAKYALQPLSAQALAALDDATIRFVRLTAGRGPDARLLSVALLDSAMRNPEMFRSILMARLRILRDRGNILRIWRSTGNSVRIWKIRSSLPKA